MPAGLAVNRNAWAEDKSAPTWMGCDGQFPVGLLDFEQSSRGRHSQGVIVCSVDHHLRGLVMSKSPGRLGGAGQS